MNTNIRSILEHRRRLGYFSTSGICSILISRTASCSESHLEHEYLHTTNNLLDFLYLDHAIASLAIIGRHYLSFPDSSSVSTNSSKQSMRVQWSLMLSISSKKLQSLTEVFLQFLQVVLYEYRPWNYARDEEYLRLTKLCSHITELSLF